MNDLPATVDQKLMAKLLRENIRLRRFSLVLLGGILVVCAAGAIQSFEHGEMRFIDGRGLLRAEVGVIGTNPRNSRIWLRDDSGEIRLMMGTQSGNASSSLTLFGAGQGRVEDTRVEIVEQNGSSMIRLNDGNGRNRVELGVDEAGRTVFLIRDGQGNQRNLATF